MTGARAETIGEIPFLAAQEHAALPAQRYFRDGAWHDVTFEELADVVLGLARGLVALGVETGDRVALLSSTRPEWSWVDFAASAVGAVVVPIYPTSSAEECGWVLAHSGATVLLCEDATRVEALRATLPDLRTILTIAPPDLEALRALGESVDPAEVELRMKSVDPQDVATIIYTSGTTGPPKGCQLTHAGLAYACDVIATTQPATPQDVVYLHLPLAHVYARLAQLACGRLGVTLAYGGGDPRALMRELAEVRPTILPSVPRLFEKLYTAATSQPDPHAALRQLLGGRVRRAGTGAAPIATDVLELFEAAGVPLLEGYGMSESTGIITTQTVEEHRLGTVGRAIEGTDVRLSDDGEILVRGPNVFAGYFRDPEGTDAAIVDGWLRTGDLGVLDEDGYLRITGRTKDIIITSSGKNLAPAGLENRIRQSRWVSHVVMYGDRRPYAVAVITLDADEITVFAAEHGIVGDVAELSRHPVARALVQHAVDEANAHYAPIEQIKRFHVLDHDLSQEAGDLTPTLKVKRSAVHRRLAGLFEALYEEEAT